MKMTIRMSPHIFNNISLSIFEECDPDMAQQSIPGNLKILDGLLKSDSQNTDLLRLLTMGYSGYSLLFIEGVDNERASALYLRAARYGFKVTGFSGIPDNISKEELNNQLNRIADKKNTDSFMWATASWCLWINLNIHKPEALAQLGNAQMCIDKLAEKYPDNFYGLPYLLKALSHLTILEFMKDTVKSKTGFLLILNLFQLLIGCMMDIFSAILIVVPFIIPMAQEFGINPLHLEVVFMVNLSIGYTTRHQ